MQTYAVEFEWDPGKAAINLKKHGISFSETLSVFSDPLELTISDPDIAEVFKDSDAVNHALRMLIELAGSELKRNKTIHSA